MGIRGGTFMETPRVEWCDADMANCTVAGLYVLMQIALASAAELGLPQPGGEPCPKGFLSVKHQLGRAGHWWPLSPLANRGKINEEKLPDFIFFVLIEPCSLCPPFSKLKL